jgi:signal transduction histidine kinase
VTKNANIPELGVGIPGMRSRVRQFGGDLSLTSGRRGTMVRASIPLQKTITATHVPEADLRFYRNGAVAPSR